MDSPRGEVDPSEDDVFVSRPHSPENLDDAFRALAHPYRRVVVQELDWGQPASLDDLAAVVADRVAETTADDARLWLAHNHLPHLADADIITYDADEGTCELDDAVTARAILSSIRTDG